MRMEMGKMMMKMSVMEMTMVVVMGSVSPSFFFFKLSIFKLNIFTYNIIIYNLEIYKIIHELDSTCVVCIYKYKLSGDSNCPQIGFFSVLSMVLRG